MLVRDESLYPKLWLSSKVTTRDSTNGKFTTRIFYANNDYTSPVFKWVCTYDDNEDFNKFQTIILVK